MKSSEQLLKIAKQLEANDNHALIRAEENGTLEPVAEILVSTAATLRKLAETLILVEPTEENTITIERLKEMAAIASEFSSSGDSLLEKTAGVLDDLLVILADRSELLMVNKKAEDQRLEELKKKYQDTLERQKKNDAIKEAEKAVEKSPAMKEYRSQEAALSARYCPEHAGVSLAKLGDGQKWQCPLNGKILDFSEGFQLDSGNRVPGGDVNNQSQFGWGAEYNTFNSEDSRASRLGYNNQYK